MDFETYVTEAEVESSHWWFVTRRKFFARVIQSLKLNKNADILDLGTSTGTNLKMLQAIGMEKVQGLDFSQAAIDFCKEKGFDNVLKGDICAIPLNDCTQDLVLATDIIEHVDDDGSAIREIHRVLRPEGLAIITVPAFKCLWGKQDEIGFHKRRYRKSELLKLMVSNGLVVSEIYYYNYLLFIPIYIMRKLFKLLSVNVKNENSVNSIFLNKVLTGIFMLDAVTAKYVKSPFGVSIFCLCVKSDSI